MEVVKLAVAPEERDEVVAAATQALVTDGGWSPPPDDRAGVKVVVDPKTGTLRLRDPDDKVARWFCFWRNGVPRAGHRICWPRGGKLHLERYGIALPKALKKYTVVELNRLFALDGDALLKLLRGEIEWLCAQGVDFIVTTSRFPDPRDLYVELGMQPTAVEFRYHPTDPHPAQVLVAPLATVEWTRLWHVTNRLAARKARRMVA